MYLRSFRSGLSALALSAFATTAAAACTFPSVEYDDAMGPACDVTSSCVPVAKKCGDDARKARDKCLEPCAGTGPGGMQCVASCDIEECIASCDTLHTTTLNNCNTDCRSCGQMQGCTNPVASCASLVGSG